MAVIEKLNAHLDGIGHLLADRYIAVPPNQRAYSWTEEQITELLRDLSDAIHKHDTEYFLGTVVLTKSKSGAHAVIDGQQRLATISILICAIRNYFFAQGDHERADGLHSCYLAKKELRSLSEMAHLTLMASDNSCYEKQILAKSPIASTGAVANRKKSASGSHERLQTALRLCTDQVTRLVKGTNDPANLLMDWVDYISLKAKVIVVEVNDEAAAYTIFEVLNDRGLELSVSDLLKNFVFQLAGSKLDEAQANWAKMTGVLEGAGLEERNLKNFVRHAWASKHGVTREKDLYDKIRKQVNTRERAVTFSKELIEQAKVYAALEIPTDELWKDYGPTVQEAIESLGLLKATQIRPLLLAVFAHFELREARKALPMLVAWTVRFTIVGKLGSGPLEQGYASSAEKISNGAIKSAVELYKASTSFLVTDEEFEASFAVAKSSAQYLARFYLRALERQASIVSGTAETIVNPSSEAVNLEHVMPLTRVPHWTKFTVDTHRAYVKRLGNLALLDRVRNERSGNLSFAEKSEMLKASAIELTQEIANFPAWDSAAIDKRQARLAKLAVQAWPLKP